MLRVRNPAALSTEFLNQPAEVLLLGCALEFDSALSEKKNIDFF